jgi:hypothetical protein
MNVVAFMHICAKLKAQMLKIDFRGMGLFFGTEEVSDSKVWFVVKSDVHHWGKVNEDTLDGLIVVWIWSTLSINSLTYWNVCYMATAFSYK